MSVPATMTPRRFVEKWAEASAKESAAAQEHFLDLCRLVGHPTPVEADPEGRTFCFEAGATKQSGGQGWADVWKRGFFAWEYKGKHADLDKAYNQLLQYREALENPPLLVVSDMATIRIHTNFTNTVKQVVELSLEDLLDPAKRRILHDLFFNPEGLRSRQTPAQVTERAAAEFGRLAEAVREWVEARDRWLHPGTLPASKLRQRTLTNLHSQAPTWLQLAYERLDAAVMDAYGWPHDLEDEEILARLLALNLARAGVN